MNTFSKRYGYKQQHIREKNEINSGLRNRIFNLIVLLIGTIRKISRKEERKFLFTVWDSFFKKPITALDNYWFINYDTGKSEYNTEKAITDAFNNLEWYEVYDFIEFIYEKFDYLRNIIKEELNNIFKDEGTPYYIDENGKIQIKFSDEEKEEIEEAILKTQKLYPEVHIHLKKAREYFNKRPEPNYKDSIRESISALEALARIVLKNPSATLGDLCNSLPIHPAFRDGLKKIYGWTSDEGGIRHSEKRHQAETLISNKDDAKFENEARLILVLAVSFINYIISKFEND